MAALEGSKVRTSMLAYMTTFGVDDWLFIINLEIGLIAVFLFRFYPWIGVMAVIHLLMVAVTKLRPHLLECYTRHMRQANRYAPGRNVLTQRPTWDRLQALRHAAGSEGRSL